MNGLVDKHLDTTQAYTKQEPEKIDGVCAVVSQLNLGFEFTY